MTRIWTPFGRSLAGLCLAVALAGCASTFPTGTFGPSWPVGHGLSEDGKGGVEGKPGSETEQPPFVGLYQTSQGPLLSRDGKLYSLNSGALKEWGKAPRSGMAWSIHMISSQEGWSVGGEGIARYKNQFWEPVVTGSHELLSPATHNGVAIRLTDVAFSDAGRGFAVGTHGTVLAYANEKWTRVESPEFGAKHFGTVRIASGQEVWVAGEDVLRFNGTAWVRVGPPEPGAEVSGLLIREDAVWASTGTDLWRWDRKTEKWDATSHLSADFLGGLQTVPGNPASLLAVAMEVGSPGGRIFGLDSGGAWKALSPQTPAQVGLDSLVMLDHDTGFALSFDGAALYKFDQGAWTTLSF